MNRCDDELGTARGHKVCFLLEWPLASLGIMGTSLSLGLLLLASAVSATESGEFRPMADLPPLLEFVDGRRVETVEQWPSRKEEIRRLLIVYYRPDAAGPRPVVIWLHPYSYHSGYNEGYGVEGTTVYHGLAQAGYVVPDVDRSDLRSWLDVSGRRVSLRQRRTDSTRLRRAPTGWLQWKSTCRDVSLV